ncbi:TPA: helix-turn-helix domain-containing protein [Salmonella bongori]|nr:helix-turn-helix domain-containing protein [Salmonella bongori]HDJ2756881.1 helix-turn-helix domain-containing protein [Salmonella bongori]HDJ2765124.1 helix-turn-helix domain-containing protein [Salmonella bongori]
MSALILSKARRSFLSRQELVQFVWSDKEQCIDNGNIVQLVFLLRKKLSQITNQTMILNLFKRGYYLNGDEPVSFTLYPLCFLKHVDFSK